MSRFMLPGATPAKAVFHATLVLSSAPHPCRTLIRHCKTSCSIAWDLFLNFAAHMVCVSCAVVSLAVFIDFCLDLAALAEMLYVGSLALVSAADVDRSLPTCPDLCLPAPIGLRHLALLNGGFRAVF